MEALKPPHTHFLSAAEGWTELGNTLEARAELERLDPPLWNHPEVLKVRWSICAQEKDWPTALETARELVQREPESHWNWVHVAYSLRRAPDGGLAAAWVFLHPALDQFPKVSIIPYNLACYACQMGRVEQARELFQRALRIGSRDALKEMALQDEDLRPLWEEIRGL